jgi:hypothetical protein
MLIRKKEIHYEVKSMDPLKLKKGKTVVNDNYIPRNKRPEWCKKQNKRRVPQFKCFSYGKAEKRCPFFAMCNAEKSDYKFLNKKYKKI